MSHLFYVVQNTPVKDILIFYYGKTIKITIMKFYFDGSPVFRSNQNEKTAVYNYSSKANFLSYV